MIAQDKIAQIIDRFQFIEAKMADGASGAEIAALGREYAELRPVVDTVTAYQSLMDQIAQAEDMLSDPEMRELAEMELPDLRAAAATSEHDVQLALLPKDAADGRPALLEIRPGTGGDEAGTRRGCSPQTCCACINAMPIAKAGNSKSLRKACQSLAALRKSWRGSRAMVCLPV